MSDMLKRQDRAEGRGRSWRSNFRRLQREVLQLEEDEAALDAVFPQARGGGCDEMGARQGVRSSDERSA